MAKKNIDVSYMPKLKGDRGKLRDKDKYREKFEGIKKSCGCQMGEKCDCAENTPLSVEFLDGLDGEMVI